MYIESQLFSRVEAGPDHQQLGAGSEGDGRLGRRVGRGVVERASKHLGLSRAEVHKGVR